MREKTCCDWECAEANGCVVGGISCARCGDCFCPSEIDADGLCDDCAREKREEEADEEEEDGQ